LQGGRDIPRKKKKKKGGGGPILTCMAAQSPDSGALDSVSFHNSYIPHVYSSYWYKSINVHFGHQNIERSECRK